jgi:hypothetical protein
MFLGSVCTTRWNALRYYESERLKLKVSVLTAFLIFRLPVLVV